MDSNLALKCLNISVLGLLSEAMLITLISHCINTQNPLCYILTVKLSNKADYDQSTHTGTLIVVCKMSSKRVHSINVWGLIVSVIGEPEMEESKLLFQDMIDEDLQVSVLPDASPSVRYEFPISVMLQLGLTSCTCNHMFSKSLILCDQGIHCFSLR